jgi:hypothetical protein
MPSAETPIPRYANFCLVEGQAVRSGHSSIQLNGQTSRVSLSLGLLGLECLLAQPAPPQVAVATICPTTGMEPYLYASDASPANLALVGETSGRLDRRDQYTQASSATMHGEVSIWARCSRRTGDSFQWVHLHICYKSHWPAKKDPRRSKKIQEDPRIQESRESQETRTGVVNANFSTMGPTSASYWLAQPQSLY